MTYKLADTVPLASMGLRSDLNVRVPMVPVPERGVLLVADPENGKVHLADFKNRDAHKTVGPEPAPTSNGLGNITGLTYDNGRMYVAAEGRDGIVLDLDRKYLGTFPRTIDEYGAFGHPFKYPVNKILATRHQLFALSDLTTSIFRFNADSRTFRSLSGGFVPYREQYDGYLSAMVQCDDVLAVLGGRDSVTCYSISPSYVLTEQNKFEVPPPAVGMASHNNLLYVSGQGAIRIYDPHNGKQEGEIRAPLMRYPTEMGFIDDLLVTYVQCIDDNKHAAHEFFVFSEQ